jgi:cell wall-associated NlpC family hydrolase
VVSPFPLPEARHDHDANEGSAMMTLHKLSAGNGYTYLTRQVAANDVGDTGYANLGVDCSGFTRWVYSLEFGSDVLGGTNTDGQIAELGTTSNPVPGDLVFFGTSTTNTHHVGIWLGNGNMIDALHTGSNVETDPVSAGGTIAGYSHLDG